MNNDRIVVADGARSPIGSVGATAAREALTRAGVEGADVREVVMGCIGQVGAGRPHRPSRGGEAGPSTNVPECTVNRLPKLDPGQDNRYGGAIALGHPVGATGTNPTFRVAKNMVRRDLEFGVVTTCIGGGQALAALFRRV